MARSANTRILRKRRPDRRQGSILTARARFKAVHLLNLFRELQAASGDGVKIAISGKEFSSLNRLAKWLARRKKISERTLWRWDRRFAEHGFTGLLDAERSDSQTSRAFTGREEAIAFVMNRWDDGFPIGEIHAELTARWRRFNRAPSKCPSSSAIRALIRSRAEADTRAEKDSASTKKRTQVHL